MAVSSLPDCSETNLQHCTTIQDRVIERLVFVKCHPGEVGVKQCTVRMQPFCHSGRKLLEMDAAVKTGKRNKVYVPKMKDVKKLIAFFEIPVDA